VEGDRVAGANLDISGRIVGNSAVEEKEPRLTEVKVDLGKEDVVATGAKVELDIKA
jgi:hypothetical protein